MAKLFLPTGTVTNLGTDKAAQGIYIGREWAGRPASDWANPFTVGTDSPERRRAVVWKFIHKLMDSELRHRLEELRGETLLCWCTPGLCHGTALAFLLSWKRMHGLPCRKCGQPMQSILNLFPDGKRSFLYEFARCQCQHYNFQGWGYITETSVEEWAEAARIEEALQVIDAA